MTDTKTDDSNFLALIPEHRADLALTDMDARKALFEHIEKEVAAFVPDLTTGVGRQAIKAFAFKITRTKTAVDAAGKRLTEDARALIAKVNEERKTVTERLAELSDQVRQPLTDWEQAEDKRVAHCETVLVSLTEMGIVPLEATIEMVERAIEAAKAIEVDSTVFQGMTEAALKAKNHTLELLAAALARIQHQEEQRLELERLRAEAAKRAEEDAARAERDQAEEAARAAEAQRVKEEAEAKERAAAEAEAEKQRIAQAKEQAAIEEAERKEREAAEEKRQAEAAAAAAEKAAAEAREEERRKAEAAIAAEKARADEAERKAAQEKADREAEERRVAAERERLERDAEHRRQCKKEAKGR